jgi:fucose permease
MCYPWHCDFGYAIVKTLTVKLTNSPLQAPPYPLFAITFFISSLAQAFQDAEANTFVSSVHASHRWLGVIHAMYGLGLLIAPPIATVIASNTTGKQWAMYYAFPLGAGVLNVLLVFVAFYTLDNTRAGEQEAQSQQVISGAEATRPGRVRRVKEEMLETLKVKSIWLLSLFYFCYLGFVITNSGNENRCTSISDLRLCRLECRLSYGCSAHASQASRIRANRH